MPLYEYQCKKCKHRLEKIQMFSDKPLKKCPECGGALEKLISQSSVQFKGSGWYVSDYGRKGASGPVSPSSSDSDSSAKLTSDTKGGKETKETKKEEKPKAETAAKKTKKE